MKFWSCADLVADAADPPPADLLDPGLRCLREHVGPLLVGDVVVLAGRRNAGKQLPVGTEVPTPTGWRRLGELRAGAVVFGSDGKPCRVTWVSPVRRPAVTATLHFDDGTEREACLEHQWVVEVARGASRYRARRTLTTAGIAELLETGCRVAVPLCAPVERSEVALPVDPYLLGVWLGDGTTETGVITTADAPEVLRGIPHHVVPSRRGYSAPGYRVHGLTAKLRELGVLSDKHIPDAYLHASVAQRKALLAGLMDSDGTASGEWCTTDRKLAVGFVELARGLGIRVRACESRARLYGRDCGPKFRVHVRPDWNPFTLARKRAGYVVPTRARRVRVVRVTQTKQAQPMCCISVDSSDHTYLVGREYRVTHNSHGALAMLAGMADAGVAAMYCSLEDGPSRVAKRLRAGYARPTLHVTFPPRHSEGLVEVIERSHAELGTRVWAVDYLQIVEWSGSAWSEASGLKLTIGALEDAAARARGCLVLLSQVKQPAPGEDATALPGAYACRGGAAIEDAADLVLGIGDVRGEPRLRVTKAKDATVGATFPLVRGAHGVLTEPPPVAEDEDDERGFDEDDDGDDW